MIFFVRIFPVLHSSTLSSSLFASKGRCTCTALTSGPNVLAQKRKSNFSIVFNLYFLKFLSQIQCQTAHKMKKDPLFSTFRNFFLIPSVIVWMVSRSIFFNFDSVLLTNCSWFVAIQPALYTLSANIDQKSSIGRALGTFGGLTTFGTKGILFSLSHADVLWA